MPKNEADSLEELAEIKEENKESTEKTDLGEFAYQNRKPIALFLVGLLLLGFGVIYYKVGYSTTSNELEVINEADGEDKELNNIVVEIAGAIEKSGVYKLPAGSRIDDLLIAAGGVSADADRVWMDKYLNRAAVLTDAQKIYIPNIDEQSNATSANFSGSNSTSSDGIENHVLGAESLININTANIKELDSLPGIGPVYGQNIIEHRPYSTVEDLLTKGALKEHVYEKIKEKVRVY